MSMIIVYSAVPIPALRLYPSDPFGQDVMTILPATVATWQLVNDVLPQCRYVIYSDTGIGLELLDPIIDTLRPGCYVVPNTPPDQPLPFPARLVGRVPVPEFDVIEEVVCGRARLGDRILPHAVLQRDYLSVITFHSIRNAPACSAHHALHAGGCIVRTVVLCLS